MRSTSEGPTVGLPLVNSLLQSYTSIQAPSPRNCVGSPATRGASVRRGAYATTPLVVVGAGGTVVGRRVVGGEVLGGVVGATVVGGGGAVVVVVGAVVEVDVDEVVVNLVVASTSSGP